MIENMQPGRELDRLVAEKVMNLCVLDHVNQYGDGCVMSDTGFDEWEKHPEYGRTEDPELLFPYSTDISAAWEVVEQLNGKYGFFLQRLGDYFSEGDDWKGWECAFGGHSKRLVTAKTSAEAICKAALLALSEEDTNEPSQ